MAQNIRIVFIHGAGLGGFIWKDIQLNYPQLLIDFPNRNNSNDANSQLKLEDYVKSAIQAVEQFKMEKLIIVAHSIGGIIGLRLAEHFKEKILGFVGVGAAIPAKGGSFVSCLPFPQKLIMPLILRFVGTRPPDASIEKGLCHDLNERDTQNVVKNFTSESKYLFLDRSNSVIPATKKLYIKLLDDRELSLTTQDKMAKNLDTETIIKLHSGHLPMLSVPEKLASVLEDFVDECIEIKRTH